MAIDSSKIGVAAAGLMDLIEAEHPDAELVDVLVIAEVDCGDTTSYRWKGSSGRRSTDTGIVAQVLEGLTVGESH